MMSPKGLSQSVSKADQSILSKVQSSSLESQENSVILWSFCPRQLPSTVSPISPSLFIDSRSSRASPLVGFLPSCISFVSLFLLLLFFISSPQYNTPMLQLEKQQNMVPRLFAQYDEQEDFLTWKASVNTAKTHSSICSSLEQPLTYHTNSLGIFHPVYALAKGAKVTRTEEAQSQSVAAGWLSRGPDSVFVFLQSIRRNAVSVFILMLSLL